MTQLLPHILLLSKLASLLGTKLLKTPHPLLHIAPCLALHEAEQGGAVVLYLGLQATPFLSVKGVGCKTSLVPRLLMEEKRLGISYTCRLSPRLSPNFHCCTK